MITNFKYSHLPSNYKNCTLPECWKNSVIKNMKNSGDSGSVFETSYIIFCYEALL